MYFYCPMCEMELMWADIDGMNRCKDCGTKIEYKGEDGEC